jgi:hypothetical protein
MQAIKQSSSSELTCLLSSLTVHYRINFELLGTVEKTESYVHLDKLNRKKLTHLSFYQIF